MEKNIALNKVLPASVSNSSQISVHYIIIHNDYSDVQVTINVYIKVNYFDMD